MTFKDILIETKKILMEEKSYHCGKPNCEPETCLCTSNEEAPNGLTLEVWEESLKKLKDKGEIGLDAWIKELEKEEEQK